MPQVPGYKILRSRNIHKVHQLLNSSYPGCLANTHRMIKKCEDTKVWYSNRKIGPNHLASFMSRMSHDTGLSKVYTKHSIHLTGCTFFQRNSFFTQVSNGYIGSQEPKQFGHLTKSVYRWEISNRIFYEILSAKLTSLHKHRTSTTYN